MAGLLPKLSFEVVRCFFNLLVIDPHNIVPPSCGEEPSVTRIVNCKDLVISFDAVPKLLSCFSDELENMAIGVGSEHNSSQGLQFFGVGSPPEGIDRGLEVTLSIFDVGVKLGDF